LKSAYYIYGTHFLEKPSIAPSFDSCEYGSNGSRLNPVGEVPEEAEPSQRGEAEGGHPREQPLVLRLRIHQGRPARPHARDVRAVFGLCRALHRFPDPAGARLHASQRVLPQARWQAIKRLLIILININFWESREILFAALSEKLLKRESVFGVTKPG
jgi:hypothetical protein